MKIRAAKIWAMKIRNVGPLRALGVLGAACVLAGVAPQAALAQFSDSYNFLQAVKKSDLKAVVEAIDQPGVTPVNTRDRTTGETALHITMGRRDLSLASYLLTHGANPNLTDASGRTPLMVAAERRFVEGAKALLSIKANPNIGNDSGETPLIRAVQLGDIEMVRVLLGGGADPNRKDRLAGMSALDYARRDERVPGLIDLLAENAKTKLAKDVQGPRL